MSNFSKVNLFDPPASREEAEQRLILSCQVILTARRQKELGEKGKRRAALGLVDHGVNLTGPRGLATVAPKILLASELFTPKEIASFGLSTEGGVKYAVAMARSSSS